MAAINSGYENGTSYTQTQGMPVSSVGLPPVSFVSPAIDRTAIDAALARRARIADEDRARQLEASDQATARQAQMYKLQMQAMQDDRNAAHDARERSSVPTSVTPTWYEYQGAATRPVGLGAQMIPGMSADVTKLPPWMRPQQSNVSYAPSTVANAQLSAMDDERFGNQMAADRARTKGQYGSDLGGTPRGTAPMLTPSNAVVPKRPANAVQF